MGFLCSLILRIALCVAAGSFFHSINAASYHKDWILPLEHNQKTLNQRKLYPLDFKEKMFPIATDCNGCRQLLPETSQSCHAYQDWEFIKECSVNAKNYYRGKLEKHKIGTYTLNCTDMEIGEMAMTCVTRNQLFPSDHCFPVNFCTDFIYEAEKNYSRQLHVSFLNNKADLTSMPAFPECSGVPNWQFAQFTCPEKDIRAKLEACFNTWKSTANDVAKGMINGWKLEYDIRWCNRDKFQTNGTGLLFKGDVLDGYNDGKFRRYFKKYGVNYKYMKWLLPYYNSLSKAKQELFTTKIMTDEYCSTNGTCFKAPP